MAVGAVLTLALAIWLMRGAGIGCRRAKSSMPQPAPTATPTPASAAPAVSPTPAESARGVRPAATPSPTATGGAAAASVTARPPWPSIQVDGIRKVEERNMLVIRFDEGVFSSTTNLAPAAVTRLRAIATQFGPHSGQFRMIVEGHSDNIPLRANALFADNDALAAARAQSVVTWLRREGGLSEAAVAVAEQPGPPPYPNDTESNRRRNRTVVLKIAPARN
jgi:flagellar motor protein MotB